MNSQKGLGKYRESGQQNIKHNTHQELVTDKTVTNTQGNINYSKISKKQGHKAILICNQFKIFRKTDI